MSVFIQRNVIEGVCMKSLLFLLVSVLLVCLPVRTRAAQPIEVSDHQVRVSAGILERMIDLTNGNLSTTHLHVDGHDLLTGPATEVSFTVTRAEPNGKPKGLEPGEGGTIDSVKTFNPYPGHHNDPATYDDTALGQTTRWVEPMRVGASQWADTFLLATPEVSTPAPDVSRLTVHARARRESALDGLGLTVIYEVYRGAPVVRKWVEVVNEGSVWRKIEKLTIDDFALAPSVSERVPLTPDGYGVPTSMVGCTSADGAFGVIVASEIPSGLRTIAGTGPRVITRRSSSGCWDRANDSSRSRCSSMLSAARWSRRSRPARRPWTAPSKVLSRTSYRSTSASSARGCRVMLRSG